MYLPKKIAYSRAYVEILEIIKCMEPKYRERIPVKLLRFFEENKDKNYKYDLNAIRESGGEVFSQETINLLAMLELKYLADETEKKVLKEALEENNKIKKDETIINNNLENLFKSKTEPLKVSVSIVDKKDNIFNKIKKWFKQIFYK